MGRGGGGGGTDYRLRGRLQALLEASSRDLTFSDPRMRSSPPLRERCRVPGSDLHLHLPVSTRVHG